MIAFGDDLDDDLDGIGDNVNKMEDTDILHTPSRNV